MRRLRSTWGQYWKCEECASRVKHNREQLEEWNSNLQFICKSVQVSEIRCVEKLSPTMRR